MPSCYVCGRSKNEKSKFENITFIGKTYLIFPVSVPPIKENWNHFVLQNTLNLNDITKHSKKNAAPIFIVSRVKSARNDYSEIVVPAPELNLVEQQANSSIMYIFEEGILPLDDNSEVDTSIDHTVHHDLETTAESEQSSSFNNSVTNKLFKTILNYLNFVDIIIRNSKASFLAACFINTNDTPRRQFLKRGIRQLNDEIQ
ncbi:THAP domain-containing protein 2-like [Aphis craccivora]|uniref:THAP domain-containing protein 2-like n=1 Tax=Aphis craccivora TaxID=307492 RepID=A0A6G0Y7W2_APHCR|nr:THAP domain-containing protein 2-like [Aphis craccivora]